MPRDIKIYGIKLDEEKEKSVSERGMAIAKFLK